MPLPAVPVAPGLIPAPPAEPHLVTLTGEWALWRDIAVRTAGFPVFGLGIFGSQDEQAGLRAMARDPLFQTAVTWQNRPAMHNAVAKIAAGAPAPGSAQRRREEVVASYWQRYCAKNDTIGFFGPLAWGRVADDGPPIQVSCGRLVTESAMYFEAWAIPALAEALDPGLAVATGPRSEHDLRTQLEQSPPGLRDRGLAALDRPERCRSAVAQATTPGALDAALGDLDRVFEELTGQSPTRGRARPTPPGPCSTSTACETWTKPSCQDRGLNWRRRCRHCWPGPAGTAAGSTRQPGRSSAKPPQRAARGRWTACSRQSCPPCGTCRTQRQQPTTICSGAGQACSPTPTRQPSGPARRRHSPTTHQHGRSASTSQPTCR